ncbi:hypothetical protein BFP72_07115 [Reichenbachiella sp. 5M10]|nr:hypothetical protein BFP72_07115 [Reichenbachiella sp. 5M10]
MLSVAAWSQQVFINEIHYDNTGADADEGVEIVGPAGTNLTGYSLIAYNGNGGTPYATVNLTGVLSDQSNGMGTAFFAMTGLQNGAPDGVALYDGSTVLQFLSYEGTFSAVGGVADGMTSTDIGVSQTSTTPVGVSLQLTGEGALYTDFTWVAGDRSYDQINVGQSFGGVTDTTGQEPVDTVVVVTSGTVFINEIHYDNAGADSGEGVELAGTAGLDLTGYILTLYNGNGGSSYGSQNLSGVFADQQAGYGTLFFPVAGLQNGSPDGVALIDPEGNVLEFLSYEGAFTAVGGAADGILSTDVVVAETSSTPEGFSLQLTGVGSVSSDFVWAEAAAATYDTVNTGQTFVSPDPIVFVNEIHYDNASSDVDEAIEVAGTAGTDLSGWSLVLYNGNGGAVYHTAALSGVLPNQDNGYGTLGFAIGGIQNGSPDGVALVDDEGHVWEFLSYEGAFVAVGGPADGMMSTDIGVTETSSTPVGFSLQLIGAGSESADFEWSTPVAQTQGAVNAGQSFGGVIVEPPVLSDTVTVAQARGLSVGTEVVVKVTLTATDQLGGPAYAQDSTAGIAIFDYQVHDDGLYTIGDQLWITAELGSFSNQIQLVNVDTVVWVGHEEVDPTVVSLADLSTVEGQLITIEGVSFDSPTGLLYPNSNYAISDGTATAELRIDADVDLVGRLVPGDTGTVTGVLGRYQTVLQLLPRYVADMPGAMEFTPGGSEVPFENTFDVTTWNMEFFGTEITGYGPSDVSLQKENAIAVLENLHADIVAVQEVSEEALLDSVVSVLPHHAFVCSQVYSYSFEAPNPSDPFPVQKLCFIYDTTSVRLLSERVVFEDFYTAARTGQITDLDDHPGSSGAQSFWSSGRLPYMMTAEVTVSGVTKEVTLVNIHAKSGASANDQARKTYDLGVLKDTLDAAYADQNVILLGDYNDDVDESIGGGPSTYAALVNDTTYAVATSSLSTAGLRSYLFADNMIDHITLSDGLFGDVISGSENTFIPFQLVENYANTTSDHLPVSVRFDFVEPMQLTLETSAIDLYYGYEPLSQSRMTVAVEGGMAPYTYLWNTGETVEELSIAPQESMTYWVSVTDGRGQVVSDSVEVLVTDVACGRYDEKVELCWRGRSLCVSEHAVTYLLEKGASLGACDVEDLPYVDKVFIGPNPFLRYFSIFMEANKPFVMNVVLRNQSGEIIKNEKLDVPSGYSCHPFSLSYAPRGMYFIELINEATGEVEKSERLYKWR